MRIGVLVRFPRPVQVIQQPPGIGAPEHFPDHPEHSRSVTECSGAIAPPPHPTGGSPARKTAPPGADHHPAARSHSAAPPPDSDSCRPAAPARPPPSAPPAPPATATQPGPACTRAAASVTSAANAPRASPDRAAAALTSSNSSSVSENCTTFGRDTACRDRRRLTVLAMTTHPDPLPRAPSGGTAPGPDQRRVMAALLPLFISGPRPVQR